MSLRYEQYRALQLARELLHELAVPHRMTNKIIRGRALLALRHYPFLHKTGEPMFSQDTFQPREDRP